MTHYYGDNIPFNSDEQNPPGAPGVPELASTREKALASWIPGRTEQSTEEEAIRRLEKYQPNHRKRSLSWFSMGVGLVFMIILLSGASTEISLIQDIMASILFPLSIAFPGIYWARANHRDRVMLKEWDQRVKAHKETRQILAGTEEEVLLGAEERIPLLAYRHWGIVTTLSFTIAMIGAMIVPVA